MNYFKSFAIFCILFTLGQNEMILNSPQITNWGDWHDWGYCSEGNYTTGMQLKTESYQGAFSEDTALNGLKFFCCKIGDQCDQDEVIASGQGDHGSFGNKYFCDGVATGFQMRSEKGQTVFADDTAGNNMRFLCNGDNTDVVEGDGLNFGDWTHAQECFKKQGICGLSTQVEKSSANDPTGLNNIKVKCCDVEDPAQVCVPVDQWELIIECDNKEAVSPTTCYYERKVGVSSSNTISEGHSRRSRIYRSIGFDIGSAISILAANFQYNLGHSVETDHDWTVSNTETWSEETTQGVSFDVPAGVKSQLFQTRGACDFYSVKTMRVKRVDTDGNNVRTVTYFNM